MPRKIIIDTDPGQDDAVAILLALASPRDLDVLGIVAVAGTWWFWTGPVHLQGNRRGAQRNHYSLAITARWLADRSHLAFGCG